MIARAAVAAYEEALKERTRERVPLDWAATICNRAVASRIIAGRTDDLPLARRALDDLTRAAEVSRDGGHIPNAEYYDAQVQKAKALVAQLECG